MILNRISKFLISESGKKLSFYIAGTLTVGATLISSLPHTIFLSQYVDLYRLYKQGMIVPLPKKLQDRFEQALDLCKIEPDMRFLFKPFAAYGFEIFNIGCAYSRFGVAVGIPANFFYDSVDDVDKLAIKLNMEPVLWETTEGKAFQNAIVLPEKAQLYAMAKEILMGNSPKFLLDVGYSLFGCLGFYALSSSLNRKLNLFSKPRVVRLLMYSLSGTFVLSNYIALSDLSQVFYEKRIDKELKKDPVLAEGAREYYSKILARNIALRKLLGKEGEHLFTACGNENFLFRTKRTPLLDRKRFFESAEEEEKNLLVQM